MRRSASTAFAIYTIKKARVGTVPDHLLPRLSHVSRTRAVESSADARDEHDVARWLLDRMPQQEPFRFIDEILSVDPDSIEASYTWREDAEFYRGHFPGNPDHARRVLLSSAWPRPESSGTASTSWSPPMGMAEAEKLPDPLHRRPGGLQWNRAARESRHHDRPQDVLPTPQQAAAPNAEMRLDDGTVVCSGTVLSGMGVPR